MPTNDPTAPRVVGAGEQTWQCEDCGKQFADERSSGFHSAMTDHVILVGTAPAVLPEDGTTPPSYDVGGLEAEPGFHEPFEKSLARGQLRAGSLRETGAGRGEAPRLAMQKGANAMRQIAGRLRKCGNLPSAEQHEGWAKALDDYALTVDWPPSYSVAARLAASPDGGAPTEEEMLRALREIDDLAISARKYDVEEKLARIREKAQQLASRLTRSPRVAGEPNDLDAEIMAQTEAELFEANNALVLLANEFERRSIPFIPAAEKATAAARAYISEHAASVEMGMKIAMQVFAERRPAAPPPERAP